MIPFVMVESLVIKYPSNCPASIMKFTLPKICCYLLGSPLPFLSTFKQMSVLPEEQEVMLLCSVSLGALGARELRNSLLRYFGGQCGLGLLHLWKF